MNIHIEVQNKDGDMLFQANTGSWEIAEIKLLELKELFDKKQKEEKDKELEAEATDLKIDQWKEER
jgi:hypothetical protein